MRDETFMYIWEKIVLKTEVSLENSFSSEDKLKYDFSPRNLNQMKKKVFESYIETRDYLKGGYYSKKDDENGDNRIDNHKIAACICYSLIINKIFKFNIYEDMPTKMYTINYELSYTVSLGFIFAMLVAQYKKNGREDFAEKLLGQKKLLVPETSFGHDEYHLGRIHSLALNDIYGNTFDILTYSDMMFWIEFYNRQLIEETLKPMPLYKGE